MYYSIPIGWVFTELISKSLSKFNSRRTCSIGSSFQWFLFIQFSGILVVARRRWYIVNRLKILVLKHFCFDPLLSITVIEIIYKSGNYGNNEIRLPEFHFVLLLIDVMQMHFIFLLVASCDMLCHPAGNGML